MTMHQPGKAEPGTGPAGQHDPLLVRAVLACYPPRWRERYGEEFAALLIDLTAGAPWAARIRLVANAIGGGVHARLHVPEGRILSERIRGSIAVAACTAMVFAAAIVGLAKMREGPAFGAVARGSATVAATVDVMRAATVLAGLAVLAGALPIAWTVLRQAATSRRPDLIRPLAIGPAAAGGWLALASITARLSAGAHRNSRPDIPAVAIFLFLGAAAAAVCAWAAITVVRRAHLTPRLLRAEVISMAILSLCMTAATAADISWGVALRAADGALFHSDNGLIATPLAPNWAGSTIVLAAVAAVTATATMRAARQLLRPAPGRNNEQAQR
jgi:hypothetical protein